MNIAALKAEGYRVYNDENGYWWTWTACGCGIDCGDYCATESDAWISVHNDYLDQLGVVS